MRHRATAGEISNLISLCRQNRLICVPELHSTTGLGDSAGAITLSKAADFWIERRGSLAGQERYVIVNIGNEPIGNANYTRWIGDTRGAISRGVGLRRHRRWRRKHRHHHRVAAREPLPGRAWRHHHQRDPADPLGLRRQRQPAVPQHSGR